LVPPLSHVFRPSFLLMVVAAVRSAPFVQHFYVPGYESLPVDCDGFSFSAGFRSFPQQPNRNGARRAPPPFSLVPPFPLSHIFPVLFFFSPFRLLNLRPFRVFYATMSHAHSLEIVFIWCPRLRAPFDVLVRFFLADVTRPSRFFFPFFFSSVACFFFSPGSYGFFL